MADSVKGASLLVQASLGAGLGGPIMLALPIALGARLEKEVKGQGGWQTLLTLIRSQTFKIGDGEYRLKVDPTLLQQMIHYSVKHGSGGYQSLIRWILCEYLNQTIGGTA